MMETVNTEAVIRSVATQMSHGLSKAEIVAKLLKKGIVGYDAFYIYKAAEIYLRTMMEEEVR